MGSRSHTHQKPGSDSTASAASVWRTRGFAPQPQPIVERTLPDLQSQIDHAQRYGHSLSKCRVSPAATPLPIQAKLTVGEVGDPYEQEADRVAQQVVQRLHESNMVSPQLARSDFLNRAKNDRQSAYLRDHRDEIWDNLQGVMSESSPLF